MHETTGEMLKRGPVSCFVRHLVVWVPGSGVWSDAATNHHPSIVKCVILGKLWGQSLVRFNLECLPDAILHHFGSAIPPPSAPR